MKLFAKITKVDVEKREVWGQAVAEVADRAKEIFDYETSLPLFRDWSAGFEKVTDGKSLGNIRAMHGKVAAGKVISFNSDDAAKSIDIGTKIVDDNEWQKCVDGVYTGFSIGGAYVKKWKDPTDSTLTRYTASPSEISLVDFPCVPTANFALVKSATETEEKPFQKYGLLKAVIDKDDLTVGELLSLTKEYLPEEAVDGLAKADAPLSEFRKKLRALVVDTPVAPVVEKVADVAAAPAGEKPAAAPPAVEAAPAVADTAAVAAAAAVPAEKVFKHLRKGMYSVSSFASLLQSLAWLAQDVEMENGWEKDASTVPADLRTALQLLCEIFKKMSAEETDEMLASIIPEGMVIEVIELAAKGDLAKAGKRHSAADLKMIQTVHDTATNLGACCADTKKAATGEIDKSAAAAPESIEKIAGLEKTVTDLTTERDGLQKRVAFLEAQPAPGKGVVRTTVTKTDDAGEVDKSGDPIEPDPKDPIGVMRKVHATGGKRITV
jgi:hypothetical protein